MPKTKLVIGQPVKPMLVAESAGENKFAEVMKMHKGKTFAEVKYDGYRVQVHKSNEIELFTRNLNPLNAENFPEMQSAFKKLPSGIFDGELVGLEAGVKGFNAVKKRMGNEIDENALKQYPLQIRFFDVLLLEEKQLIDLPLGERRRTLEQYVENVSEQEEICEEEELRKKFEGVVAEGNEGLVCKNPLSQYIIGGRTKDWIKLKNFLTLDLIVLGLYKGEGKAAELPFAALLLGTQNKGRYETITKVGIAKKEIINTIYKKVRDCCTNKPAPNIILSKELNKKTYAGKVPSCYVQPEKSIVVEVELLNITRSKNWHSCGLQNGFAYSLRIPIVRGIREDKNAKDCTATWQIEEVYNK